MKQTTPVNERENVQYYNMGIHLSVLYNPSAQALSADPQSTVINIFAIDGLREGYFSTIQGERCG